MVNNVTVVNCASISWVLLNYALYFSNNAVVIVSDATAGYTLQIPWTLMELIYNGIVI